MASFKTIELPSKPGAPVPYQLHEGDAGSSLLLVYLNGLVMPQHIWNPVIELLGKSNLSPKPRQITYDRFGQGVAPRDPRESNPLKEPGYTHDLDEVVDDLHELIATLSPDRKDRIVFVNNSIGAHVARRFADRYPGVVEGILFLDSNPGNCDWRQLWPDPTSPTFNLKEMAPEGTTQEVYEAFYNRMTTMLSADGKNKEGFDRRRIKEILPDPSKPKLKGSKTLDKGPWITVVGHELEAFSREEWEMYKVPIGIADRYTQPMWHKYNEGLVQLTDTGRGKGPLICPKSGHFVQRDNPPFVAEQLVDLLEKVEGTKSQ